MYLKTCQSVLNFQNWGWVLPALSWRSLAADLFIKEAEGTLSVESGVDWVVTGTGGCRFLVFLKMFLRLPNAVIPTCCRWLYWNSCRLSSVIWFGSVYSDDWVGGIAIDVKKLTHSSLVGNTIMRSNTIDMNELTGRSIIV